MFLKRLFSVLIMRIFNKLLTSKIITILMIIAYMISIPVYVYPSTSVAYLRVPLGESQQRMRDAIELMERNGSDYAAGNIEHAKVVTWREIVQDITEQPEPKTENDRRYLKNQTELEQATIALSLEKVVDMMEAKDIEAAPILDSMNIIPSTEETES